MTKWAQLSKEERAYRRVTELDRGGQFSILRSRNREHESISFKRRRNRYYQLLCHWCALKKATDAQNSK